MVTEAFGCTPLEAFAQPLPLVLAVLDARAFRRAWQQVEEADGRKGATPPKGPMVDAVMALQAEALKKVKEQRGL